MSQDLARKRALRALARKLGSPALDLTLLEVALTHDSYAAEHARDGRAPQSNERLEFLGDAVLGAAVAAALYDSEPNQAEGKLSRMRASLVSRAALAATAQMLGLGDFVLLGRGERAAGGAQRASVLAGVFEALVGAIFCEGGLPQVRRFLVRHHLTRALAPAADSKTALQECAQARYKKAPHYAVIAQSGPPHARIFAVAVDVAGQVLGEGSGTTKKRAEADAAREALRKLGRPQRGA